MKTKMYYEFNIILIQHVLMRMNYRYKITIEFYKVYVVSSFLKVKIMMKCYAYTNNNKFS